MVNTLGCIAIIAAVVVLLFRRVEVRLVLLVASAALFALAGHLPDFVVNIAAEMTNLKSVIPICSSMGFAYVLRLTECDRHLVHLLLRPLDNPFARGLLIPGTIAAGYIVNMAIVSQTGALAVVGSIAVPLLLRKGVSRITVGSLLLLGTSMGGELFNPGAAETSRLSKLTDLAPVVLTNRSIPLNLMGCTAALLLFWWLAIRWERRQGEPARSTIFATGTGTAASTPAAGASGAGTTANGARAGIAPGAAGAESAAGADGGGPAPVAVGAETAAGAAVAGTIVAAADAGTAASADGAGPAVSVSRAAMSAGQAEPGQAEGLPFQVNPVKAAVPFVPLVLLFAGARLLFLRPFHDHVTILAAMLIGSVVAVLSSPRHGGKLAAAFFDGTGYAYAHIISITICATIFGQGIVANGLIQSMVSLLAGKPGALLLSSLLLPWGLAALSGSGVGAAVSVMGALIPGARSMHLDPGQMGILTAMGAHYGRTMSPAAAVAILSATLVMPAGATEHELGSMTLTLTRRVAICLGAGGVVMFVAALFGAAR